MPKVFIQYFACMFNVQRMEVKIWRWGRLHHQSSLCRYGYTKDEEKYESPTNRLHPSPHTIKVYGGMWGGLCLGGGVLSNFHPVSLIIGSLNAVVNHGLAQCSDQTRLPIHKLGLSVDVISFRRAWLK